MNRTLWSLLGVVVALLIAGMLVGLLWIAVRVAIVALAAVAVLWGLRSLAARRHGGRRAIKR